VLADPRSFVLPDGRLDFRLMLEEFAAWWRQYGEFLVKGEVYHEVAPQLIFMAFLARLGLDSDRRPSAVNEPPDPEFAQERTPAGRRVTLLRA
jgi:hypothetical protein